MNLKKKIMNPYIVVVVVRFPPKLSVGEFVNNTIKAKTRSARETTVIINSKGMKSYMESGIRW